MQTPEPTPEPSLPVLSNPIAPFEDGELIPPVEVFPSPLPLDPIPTAPQVLADTGVFLAHPEVIGFIGFIGFAILCLGLSLLAAVQFARSKPSRIRRKGVASTPEVSADPFPNLLAK